MELGVGDARGPERSALCVEVVCRQLVKVLSFLRKGSKPNLSIALCILHPHSPHITQRKRPGRHYRQLGLRRGKKWLKSTSDSSGQCYLSHAASTRGHTQATAPAHSSETSSGFMLSSPSWPDPDLGHDLGEDPDLLGLAQAISPTQSLHCRFQSYITFTGQLFRILQRHNFPVHFLLCQQKSSKFTILPYAMVLKLLFPATEITPLGHFCTSNLVATPPPDSHPEHVIYITSLNTDIFSTLFL